jgi:hypothetical protein
MNSRTYFKILGISPTKDEKVIRKAYHKKALKFHPDRNYNPSATDKFILINEAYEKLTLALEQAKKSRPTQHTHSNQRTKTQTTSKAYYKRKTTDQQQAKTAKEEFDEKLRKARERYENMKRREAAENEHYFKSITSGKKWKFYKVILVACSIVALLLFLDHFLPTHLDKAKIVSSNNEIAYGGMKEDIVTPIILNSGEKLWVRLDFMNSTYNRSEVYVDRSLFLKDIQYISAWTNHGWVSSYPDYSIVSTFPIVPLFLCIPLIAFFVRSKTIIFSLLFSISSHIMPFFLGVVLISNDRWLHLISLGLQ